MSYLLDTNALIGLLFYPEILSEEANRIIQESDELSVSIASLWEMGIKQSVGKMDIDASAVDISDACKKLEVGILPMWVLGQTEDSKEIREYFQLNLCGEVQID